MGTCAGGDLPTSHRLPDAVQVRDRTVVLGNALEERLHPFLVVVSEIQGGHHGQQKPQPQAREVHVLEMEEKEKSCWGPPRGKRGHLQPGLLPAPRTPGGHLSSTLPLPRWKRRVAPCNPEPRSSPQSRQQHPPARPVSPLPGARLRPPAAAGRSGEL